MGPGNHQCPTVPPPGIVSTETGLQKIVHYLGGIFIWEFFSTIWFEWSFITGKRPYRWSILVYSTIRLATLLNVFADLVKYQVIEPMECQGWLYFEFATVYLSFILGELLMILKISAVWCRNKWILATSICAWLTNIAFVIHCIVMSSADRESDDVNVCLVSSAKATRDTTLATLSTETFLLLVMLMGLLRERDHYLGRFLFNRGLVWLCVAIFAQVPLILLLSFNFQELGFVVLHTLSLLSMAICVTRIYRGLGTVNDCRCAKACLNIGTSGPTGGSIMMFASYHADRPRSVQTQTTEPIAISVQEEEEDDADEGTPLEPRFPTTTASRGHDAA